MREDLGMDPQASAHDVHEELQKHAEIYSTQEATLNMNQSKGAIDQSGTPKSPKRVLGPSTKGSFRALCKLWGSSGPCWCVMVTVRFLTQLPSWFSPNK